MNDLQATPQKALVTAGASGIGRVIALALSDAGFEVHVCDVDPGALDRIGSEAPGLHAHPGDVSDANDVERVFAAVDAYPGAFYLLVNNAGVAGPTAPVQDIEPDDWRATLRVNLDGAFLCARAAAPRLLEGGGGVILNIASNAALFGFPNRLPYTVSKWGLIGFTKTLAMELGPRGIRVNALCPGSVSGPRIDGVIERDAAERGLSPDAVRREYARQSSLRCFVDAEDVASMAVFLASPAGARISGQAIAIDGHTEGLFQFDKEDFS
ncbi:MAG: SDR family oxidoreductase [Xanthomonadales bacterium]|nr:SDR family oxidoreductase [Xanthomonadales bacterium]